MLTNVSKQEISISKIHEDVSVVCQPHTHTYTHMLTAISGVNTQMFFTFGVGLRKQECDPSVSLWCCSCRALCIICRLVSYPSPGTDCRLRSLIQMIHTHTRNLSEMEDNEMMDFTNANCTLTVKANISVSVFMVTLHLDSSIIKWHKQMLTRCLCNAFNPICMHGKNVG